MEGIIVLYASAQHFNTMIVLASYIAKHHPSIPVTILSSADASVSAGPSITYRRLPTVVIPPNSTTHPVEGFFELYRLQNPALRVALEEISQKSRIRAFVIDFFCNYAVDVSASLEIPTYFYVSSGVPIVCLFLYLSTIDETVATDLGDLRDFVDIPGLPTIHSSDLPDITFFRRSNVYKHTLELSKNMQKSCGILTNGFDALDFRAKEALANGLCVPKGPTPPVYFIGPLLAGGDAKTGGGEHECLRWLDEQPSKSVIFLCFGRRGFFSGKQLKEMALGLERSGHSFLWSVRNPPGKHSAEDEPDLKELLPEGFLERTQGRGFVVKTWAPQKEVLSHGAVCGFVTHCGRTSIMEAVANGIPMIGWPLNAEQRMNRVIMVEDKLALPLEEEEDGFVTAAELEKRVRELMGSENGRDVRHRIGKMKISAAAAMQENGTSVVALKKFIDSAARD